VVATGQGIGAIEDRETCAQIIGRLVADASAALTSRQEQQNVSPPT
jgi:hypothetical protein